MLNDVFAMVLSWHIFWVTQDSFEFGLSLGPRAKSLAFC